LTRLSRIRFFRAGDQRPRFWWKAITRAAGLLDEEYPDFSTGLDLWVTQVLELDRESTLRYLREKTPSYPEFEAWVVQTRGRKPDWRCVNAWNDFNVHRQHFRPNKIAETYGDIGLPDDCIITSAVVLNCLQDWQLFYERDLETLPAPFSSTVVPLISSLDYGPLKIRHLPSLWLKSLLSLRNCLDLDSIDGEEATRDGDLLEALGISYPTLRDFVATETPDYLAFETWVRALAGDRFNSQEISSWNAGIAPPGRYDAKLGNRKPVADSPIDAQNLSDWERAYGVIIIEK